MKRYEPDLEGLKEEYLDAVLRAALRLQDEAQIKSLVEEGGRELEALERFFTGLSPREFNVLQHTFLNAGPGAPVCFAVQKMRTADAPAE